MPTECEVVFPLRFSDVHGAVREKAVTSRLALRCRQYSLISFAQNIFVFQSPSATVVILHSSAAAVPPRSRRR